MHWFSVVKKVLSPNSREFIWTEVDLLYLQICSGVCQWNDYINCKNVKQQIIVLDPLFLVGYYMIQYYVLFSFSFDFDKLVS